MFEVRADVDSTIDLIQSIAQAGITSVTDAHPLQKKIKIETQLSYRKVWRLPSGVNLLDLKATQFNHFMELGKRPFKG